MPTFRFLSAIVSLLAVAAAVGQTFEKPAVYLLKGGKVVVAPGRVLDKADVLILNGVIAQIGPSVNAPSVAQVIDCDGLTVYAGLIHPLLRVNVEALQNAVAAAVEADEDSNDPWNSAGNLVSRFRVAELRQDEVSAFESLAENGYGIAHVYAPAGVFGPRTAVVSIGSGGLEPAGVIAADPAIPVQIGRRSFRGPGGGGYPGSLMGSIAFTRQSLYDAGRYGRLTRRYEANPAGLPRPEYDPDLEAINRLLRRDSMAIFDGLTELSALQAMRISDEFPLQPVYAFSREAGYVTDLLKDAGAAVILRDGIPSKPSVGDDDTGNSIAAVQAYFNELQAGAELEKNGIEFSYAPSGTSDPLEDLRLMVRAGLSREAALAAVTTRPAELLGLSRSAGTVEAGKLGNVLVVQGDLFDESSQVMAAFVDGVRVDFEMPDRKDADEMKPEEPLKLIPPDYSLFPRPAETEQAFRLYKNATVWTMGPQGVLKNADVLIQNGKIAAVGRDIQAPAGCEVIDATGKHISAGVWDCHSHTAITGGVNESTNMVTIECRIKDVINHRDINIYRQLAGGTVGAQQLHGSANAIGGQTAVSKWRWGQRSYDFPVQGAPEGVKFALGENPIDEDGNRGNRPRTRMGVEDAIRGAFDAARDYVEEWEAYRSGRTKVEPRRNLQLDAIVELLNQDRFVHSHGYRQDEFLTLMRLCQEYGVGIRTFQHVLEGYKIADEMAEAGIGGSTFADWWGYKLEAYDAIPHNAALMNARGVTVSINSDSADHARRLNHEAAKSMRYDGVDAETALSFVTIEPARQLGIERWTGSLEVGKDADMVVWSASPVSIYAQCEETYVDGVKLFDIRHHRSELQRREEFLAQARELLSDEDEGDEEDTGNGVEEEVTPLAVPGLARVDSLPGNAKYPREAVLITGATIHPMLGDPFKGDVLIGADGLIKEVGSVRAPRGTARVDGSGKHLYPGIVDASTTLGLTEVPRIAESVDVSERGDFNPHLHPERAVNPDSALLYVARSAGVLTALTRPTGSGIPGQAALLSLDGYTWEDFALKGGSAIVLQIGGGGGFRGFRRQEPSPRVETLLEKVTGYLEEAREYAKAREAAENGEGLPVPRDDRLEVMKAAADGDIPFLAVVNSGNDMKAVVEWAEKENVGIQLTGCSGAEDIAEWLAEKQVPIILNPKISTPRRPEAPVDDNFGYPGRLMKAGVRFCLASNGSHNVRQIREMAGFAASYGMDREDAVRAITLWPAEILGLGHRLGAIQTGYEGTVILTDGDLLETATRVLRAWIRGREVDLTDKQTRLYDKYRNRPKVGG
ncbi:MAG: amidohydrolase family protein [Armatimonadetes bacterium]|nr:amidohydrolase family protein [Armatimonadota bacterium]